MPGLTLNCYLIIHLQGYGGFSVGGAGDLSHESAAELLADTCGTLRRSGNGTSHNQHSNNTSSRAHRIPQVNTKSFMKPLTYI